MAVIALSGCGRIGFASSDGGRGSDSGGDDAGDAGNLACAGVICDRFDGPALDPRWMADTGHGTIAVDTGRVHRGTSSVHLQTQQITTSVTNPRALLLGYQGLGDVTQVEGNITGTIYTRAWMYFASPSPPALFDQVINFADQPGNGVSIGARAGYMVVNDYTEPGYAESTTDMLPLDRWTCLQMEVASGTTATTRLFVDGVELANLALAKTTPQPRPTHVYLGLEWVGTTSSQAAADAWIDDVIVDTVPHTCAD